MKEADYKLVTVYFPLLYSPIHTYNCTPERAGVVCRDILKTKCQQQK